jgi:hypothetical protein
MIETEILIIGGGIAGASTAYYLAQYGRHVTLLERNDIASEASGVNAGAIGAIGWGNVPNLESYLTMGSLEIFKSLQVELGYDIEFRRSGSLQAIQTEAEYAYIQRRALELRSQGYIVDLLSTQEAQMIEPTLSPALPSTPSFLGFTGLASACIAWSSRRTSASRSASSWTRSRRYPFDKAAVSSTAFCLALVVRPSNSDTNSRRVLARPPDRSRFRYAAIRFVKCSSSYHTGDVLWEGSHSCHPGVVAGYSISRSDA